MHILISIPRKHAVSQMTGYSDNKTLAHIAWDHVGRRRNFTRQQLWARGCFVLMVGIDELTIRGHIR